PGVKRMAPPPPRELEIVEDAGMRGGAFVQHAGSWLMLGMLQAQGLYEAATRACAARVPAAKLRVALDAVAIALTLGQACVEGVRRVATPTAPELLRATGCPSPHLRAPTVPAAAASRVRRDPSTRRGRCRPLLRVADQPARRSRSRSAHRGARGRRP